MPWFTRKDGQVVAGEENKNSDIEIDPAKFKAELEESSKKQFEEFKNTLTEQNKPILEMAAALKAEREEKETARKKAIEDKNREDGQVTDEDFLLDPTGAVDKKLQGTNNAIRMLASREARRETLGDKEYYYGDIKKKVDAMIDQQPLGVRHDTSVIENCYKLVMYDHQKDIAEGKIKARNTSAIFEQDSTGGHSGKGSDNQDEALTKEEEHIASRMGFTSEEWKKSKKELTYV